MRYFMAVVFIIALIGVAGAATINVDKIGSNGWYADDTRDSTGTGLVGLTNTHYGIPGQIPTAADDTAIDQQILFVPDAPGSIEALKFVKNSGSGMGKDTISIIDETGFATGSTWPGVFYARYPYYTETTNEAPVIKIGIQSALWSQSQSGFTAIRSGESAWDLILVCWDDTPTAGSWQNMVIDPDKKIWYVYRQAGNSYFAAPLNTKRSLNDLAAWTEVAKNVGGTDYTWGDVLFGPGAKVTSVQFGIGSSTGNSVSYVDWVETSLLNGGERIDFVAPGSGPTPVPEFPTMFLSAAFIIGMLAVVLFVRISGRNN